MDRLSHPFPPLYDAESRILILGSFPSVKSREAMFFYGHPQNRFWRVISSVLGCDCPRTIEEKQRMLHAHHIALWDTIASCEISGSSDSSIREAVPTDLTPILQTAPIRQIFCSESVRAGKLSGSPPPAPPTLLGAPNGSRRHGWCSGRR